jgi:hypothetical protein
MGLFKHYSRMHIPNIFSADGLHIKKSLLRTKSLILLIKPDGFFVASVSALCRLFCIPLLWQGKREMPHPYGRWRGKRGLTVPGKIVSAHGRWRCLPSTPSVAAAQAGRNNLKIINPFPLLQASDIASHCQTILSA